MDDFPSSTSDAALSPDRTDRIANAVCAVIPTYGDRFHLCERAVAAALAAGAAQAVVVSNGADPSSERGLQALADTESRVRVVSVPANEGSARGFGRGITSAAESDCSFAWLLDDDNLPAPGALAEILAVQQALANAGQSPVVLFSYRPGRWNQRRAVEENSAALAYPPPGAFLSFDVRQHATKLARGLQASLRPGLQKPSSSANGCIPIPYGPFGGMLLPCDVARALDPPMADLVMYEDDSEYTARLARSGAALFLVPGSTVDDAEDSWYAAARGGNRFSRMLSTADSPRAYYATRNRVYFERTHAAGSPTAYSVNRAVFLFGLALTALLSRRWDAFRTLRAAIGDGDTARLGPKRGIVGVG